MRAAHGERAGEQERNDPVQLDGAFLVIGEGGDILTGNEMGTVAQRDIHQGGRAVANRSDNATRLVNAAGEVVDRRACRKVPHCAVSAGEKIAA